jgi:hypothetical protein
MRRNATVSDAEEPNAASELSPAQQHVVAALLAGRSITDAASAGDVDRSTVHRWMKRDFTFIAELNGGRQRLREETESRLLAVASQATEMIEQAIQAGNVGAAIAVLRGLGFLSGRAVPIGSDDAEQLREERANQALMRSLMGGPFGL